MQLLITSRIHAERILKSKTASAPITHIVSIGAEDYEQREPHGFQEFAGQKIRLVFHDINGTDRDNLSAPKEEHVRNLIEFFEKALKEKSPNFLIHCFAGISRSTAAGLIMLRLHYGETQKALAHLLNVAPQACPNKTILKLADDILKLNGNFVKEVDETMTKYSFHYKRMYG